MESHSEMMAVFLPELVADIAAGAAPRLPAVVAQGDVPAELDFLALLEQEGPLNAGSLAAEQQPLRQLLPTSGQTLPLAVSSEQLPPQPQPQLLLGMAALPGKPISATPLNDAPRVVVEHEFAETVSVVPRKTPRELLNVAQPPRLTPAIAEPPQVVAVSPLESVASPELPSVLQRPGKQPAEVGLTGNLSSQVDVEGGDSEPPKARLSGQQVEAGPRVTAELQRFEVSPPLRSDLASAAASSSAPVSMAPVIPIAPMLERNVLVPGLPNRAQNLPGAFPEIVDSVRVLSNQKGGEMRLRLNPPELGHLDIKVSVSEEQTVVSITATNSNARDVLEQNIARLRTLLDAAGLNLADAHVSDQSHPDRNQAEELPEWANLVAAPKSIAADHEAPVVRLDESHRVDLFA